MLGTRVKESIKNQAECMSLEEQYATAEGLRDEVLIGEYIRRHEEMKTIIASVKDSFRKNMEDTNV